MNSEMSEAMWRYSIKPVSFCFPRITSVRQGRNCVVIKVLGSLLYLAIVCILLPRIYY